MVPRLETPPPPGVKGTYGNAVIRWTERELHLRLGTWQRRIVKNALRYDGNGDLIHRIALVSTGRQNGKSVIVRSIFGWILDEGHKEDAFKDWTTILAAAHDAKQARIIYRGVYNDLERIPRLTKVPDRAHGEKAERPLISLSKYVGIETQDGLTFDTVTAEPGSARGTSVGAIAWDEMLTQRDWDMWAALSSTQIAQRNPLMILTSTAGYADSVILRSFYDRLQGIVAGTEEPDPQFYGAWWQSEDPEAGLDWKAVRQANPALGAGRLSRAALAMEYRILPREEWAREHLNHFVDTRVPGAFNPGVWAALRAQGPLQGVDPPFYLGVDVQPGWERASIYVAAVRPDGRIGVEPYRDLRAERDGPITAERLIAEVDAFPDPVAVVAYEAVIGAGAAFARHNDEAWGVEWRALNGGKVATACMDVTEMILSGRLAVDDPLLDAQIPTAARRNVGQDGAFRFSRAESSGPIDAVFAMTFAVHAAASAVSPPRIL